MEHAFEIYTERGISIERYPYTEDVTALQAAILTRLEPEAWYRLRYHACSDSLRKPCQPWETVAAKGDMPEEST